jgi:cellulose synthase/poly-beta-1,6-N-acetylglucosamine synthase-like glycosyltransferase
MSEGEGQIGVTVGICAYNEEQNIGRLLEALLAQRTKVARMDEVLVVASGCSDRTPEIVEDLAARDMRIRLLVEERRRGKASAINQILRVTKADVVVLESADTIPGEDAIELLVRPFLDESVGVVASRPLPVDDPRTLLGSAVHVQWLLHHLVSTRVPKTGEMFAFRRVIDSIPDGVGADEDWIRYSVERQGYSVVYVPEAVVYNSGPKSLAEFLKQRVRCNVQELYQSRQVSFSTPTWRPGVVWNAFVDYLRQREPDISGLLMFTLLEALARAYSLLRVRLRAEDLPVWDALPSTKVVRYRK